MAAPGRQPLAYIPVPLLLRPHLAVFGGGVEVVTALLGAGADPKVRNNSDELPFDYARDNEKLQGTDAYWKLNEARFP